MGGEHIRVQAKWWPNESTR